MKAQSNYSQVQNTGSETHFSSALFGEVETSKMIASPVHLTTFNAGDIVPIYCQEVLPDDVFDIDLDFVIRQTTLLTPTMGNMDVDFYAFFVPNRIVNKSWKAVMGENFNGSWTANAVSLAPLKNSVEGSTQIPVGSVADYYGFPTQQPIPNSVLAQCHDLKFRGYVMIYNEYFRDQNYQPPIPMSFLNVYQGFLDNSSASVPLDGNVTGAPLVFNSTQPSDGSFGAGAVSESLYGSGTISGGVTTSISAKRAGGSFRAVSSPLKANKHHDYFTSGLPSPQKGGTVFAPVSGTLSGRFAVTTSTTNVFPSTPLEWARVGGSGNVGGALYGQTGASGSTTSISPGNVPSDTVSVAPSNLVAVANNAVVNGLALSVDDIRMASAIQQVYECLARGGSRYRSIIRSFFGLEVDDPFSDIPQYLGHIRRGLDLYQTAQTSASASGSTPQGNLSAFGYTSNRGKIVSAHRFVEHGYLHIFAVVRQRNIYPSFMARDNFRLSMLDFYQPQLANISEEPVYVREINPFAPSPDSAFTYQEAWAEYRYEPDYVTGYMRPGVSNSLSLWNYADDFSSSLQVLDGSFLRSNAQAVLDRTLAVTSSVAPQFKSQFRFTVEKIRPLPTYSVPGMDII